MLSENNILILDEPGNHLDVDTVESLAEALVEYQGTVIFTSHDRHFTNRVATCIVEVRDGRVVNYSGNYESYVYKVNQEIEAGERELAKEKSLSKAPKQKEKEVIAPVKVVLDPEVEIKVVEKTIAQLDSQKRHLNKQLEKCDDVDEMERVEKELAALEIKLSEEQDRWAHIQEQLGGW